MRDYDYMRALYQRFAIESEDERLQMEIQETYDALRENVSRQDREKLLRLVDLEMELQEDTSLLAFVSGFRLATGIAGELEPYSFADEEEARAIRLAEESE